MVGIILCIVFGVIFIGMGIFIYSGRGWWLIAGYNMSSKSEREKYDEKALCKFIGGIVVAVGVLTAPLAIVSIAGWYFWVYITATVALAVFGSVYSNTKRFKKK